MQLFAAGTKQAASLFDIGIWVVPRFIRPLQCFSVRDFFMHSPMQGSMQQPPIMNENVKEKDHEGEIGADQGRGNPPDQ